MVTSRDFDFITMDVAGQKGTPISDVSLYISMCLILNIT